MKWSRSAYFGTGFPEYASYVKMSMFFLPQQHLPGSITPLPAIDSIYLPARVFAGVVHCQVGLISLINPPSSIKYNENKISPCSSNSNLRLLFTIKIRRRHGPHGRLRRHGRRRQELRVQRPQGAGHPHRRHTRRHLPVER